MKQGLKGTEGTTEEEDNYQLSDIKAAALLQFIIFHLIS
jgi:hypothetical protein